MDLEFDMNAWLSFGILWGICLLIIWLFGDLMGKLSMGYKLLYTVFTLVASFVVVAMMKDR